MAKTPDFPEPPRQQGISLHELTEAFAQAMGNRPKSASEVPSTDPGEETAPQAEADAPEDRPSAQPTDLKPPDDLAPRESEIDADDEACPISPLSILEAMLFVGDPHNAPLLPSKAAEPMRGVEPGEIPQLVDQLNLRYQTTGCPYRIVGDGAGYRLSLIPEYDWVRNKVLGRARQARLSQAAIDVLAIVAYQQPLTADDVSRLRGTPSNHVLAQLVRRQLLRIEKVSKQPRTVHYYTTERFLELFGLGSLADIPQSEEVERR